MEKTAEKILEALKSLYEKTDAILFELEELSAEIRENLNRVDAASLAEEALADECAPPREEKKKYWDEKQGKWVRERPVPIGKTGLPEPELDIW